MNDPGHNYRFGAPKGGWPSFGPTGAIIRDDDTPATPEDVEPCRDRLSSKYPLACALFSDGARPCQSECRL